MRTCQESLVAGGEEDDASLAGVESFSFAVKPADVTALRAAASDITGSGARLHELMRREGEEVQEARGAALRFLEAASGNLNARAETEYVERSIHDAIATAKVSDRARVSLPLQRRRGRCDKHALAGLQGCRARASDLCLSVTAASPACPRRCPGPALPLALPAGQYLCAGAAAR